MNVTKVRLRSYNVGFGDGFLLTIFYDDGSERHALIDCGSTAGGTGPKSMRHIADAIADHTGGKLHMVVATHRHADHISGFAGSSGRVIAGLKPDLVVQPWTEDPELEPDATAPIVIEPDGASGPMALVKSLGSMQALADSIARDGTRLAGVRGLSKTMAASVQFLGETNIKNRPAVKNLIAMGEAAEHGAVYASFGCELPVNELFPKVSIEVLGPPTLDQSPGIASMASRQAQEYWHMSSQRATRTRNGDAKPLFPARKQRKTPPQEARWIVPQVERAHANEMLGIVRSLDRALNNTSLILLVKVAGITLLFPGDAQIENWRYALFEAPNRREIIRSLAATDVYKVGHHGSLNATPKTVWNAFAKRSTDENAADRLITMLSTKRGKHGDARSDTEVPRRTLVEALKSESDYHSTARMRSTKTFWKDVVLHART